MRAFACPVCRSFVAVEAHRCDDCGAPPGLHLPTRAVVPADEPVERPLFDWHRLSLLFNRVNTAMGKNPLYPFDIPPAVTARLGFVHRVVRDVERN